MCKVFNLKTELVNLKNTVEENTSVDMLLESLPDQIEFERFNSSIYYGVEPSIYTAAQVQFLLRPPDKRSYGAGAVKKKRKVGFAMKLTTMVWIEVMNTRIALVNQRGFARVTYVEVTSTSNPDVPKETEA